MTSQGSHIDRLVTKKQFQKFYYAGILVTQSLTLNSCTPILMLHFMLYATSKAGLKAIDKTVQTFCLHENYFNTCVVRTR